MKNILAIIAFTLVTLFSFGQDIPEQFMTQGTDVITVNLNDYYDFSNVDSVRVWSGLNLDITNQSEVISITPHNDWYIGREECSVTMWSNGGNSQYYSFIVTVKPITTQVIASTLDDIQNPLNKTLLKAWDMTGTEIDPSTTNTMMIYEYTDGSSERLFIIE